jgi:hypothetical protein
MHSPEKKRRLKAVPDPAELARSAQEWIYHADDKVLACRGQGHNWPKLPRKKGRLPRGVRLSIYDEFGCFAITQRCLDGCGKERTLITLPGGQLDLPAKYQYNNPPRYVAPKGVPVGRRACLAEVWRRALEDGILEQPAAPPIPDATFQAPPAQ